MFRSAAAVFLAITLIAPCAGAQSTTRWTLTWTDDSFRYVDGQRVPVGEQSAVLSVTPTPGDSVLATLPTANPAIVDTLDGTLTGNRLVLQSRVRSADARPADGASRGGFTFTMQIELTIEGDRATGSRQRRIAGPPGVTVLPSEPTRLTAQRLP